MKNLQKMQFYACGMRYSKPSPAAGCHVRSRGNAVPGVDWRILGCTWNAATMKKLVFKDNHFCKSFGITSQTKIAKIYKSLIVRVVLDLFPILG